MKITLLLALLCVSLAAPARAKVPSPKDLSVEELVGQVFMIAIDTPIAAAREADIRSGRLSGALLRWDKFDGDQARAFSAKLREWSASSPHAIPFWVSTDHEGGPTFTMRRYGGAPYPGNLALGAAGSEKFARDAAREMGEELRSMGISITFAPDLDVNNNPLNPIIGLRSFGEDPKAVARLGVAALKGYRDGGVLAVPKHFPGHGETADDSHTGLPISTKTLTALEATELVPFRAAIAAGTRAIMPAHMVMPALGTAMNQPVTLSSAALDGFLRGKMGFQGLVFSDNLDMGAIANVYGSSEAAVLSLLAGQDVLMLGKGDFPSSFAAVVDAVNSGRLPRKRLEATVGRILAAKRRLGLFGAKPAVALSAETKAAHAASARRIAEAAVTLVRNDGTLPLKLAPEQVLGVVLVRNPRYPDEAALFASEVAKRHPRVEFVDIPAMFPSTAAVENAYARLSSAAVVIAGTYQFGVPVATNTVNLVQRLAARPAPLVAVSLMNPYDLAVTTGARAQVCAYGFTNSSIEASVRLMFGEIPAKGRLPVTVPGVAARGDGLRPKSRR